jgi:hypothetical protein
MTGALLSLSGLWAYQRQFSLLVVGIGLAVCTAMFLYQPVRSAPWRPLYVGVAAYRNPYMNNLSDMAMYDLYKARTGLPYRYTGSDLAQENRLANVLREEVTMLWNKAPDLFIRHALVNTLLAFSTGYVNGGGDRLNYALAALGLLIAGWLLWKRRYWFVLAILAAVGTFTPYYPPIPAYMYGAYLLLVMAFVAPAGKKQAA